MTTKISEAKFEALKSKLRELFELDKSDLDFGIYRIMAAKNKEVTAFLDRHLRETVRGVLESSGSDESAKLSSEIAKAREAAATAGFNPDDSPRVKELKEQYAKLGGGSTEELEADIYNHLLNFFSRYYDEGDFISKRYYKGDTYALPYGGEEVTLHWVNKEQYYIKSGEWHKDYRFRIDEKTVHFRLVEATGEVGNNKESDQSKRRHILVDENPVLVDENSQTLTLRFEFRVPREADEKRVEASEATRIFGGNYNKNSGRAKGDARECFCADAESRALEFMPESWKDAIRKLAPTDAKPNRTILGKYLDHFTARNTFDYFIHKDLGGFLNRELEQYLKTDVLRLGDIESLRIEQLALLQKKAVAIRRSAMRIVDFLQSLENFQRRLWRKKKFVLGTNWIFSAGVLTDDARKQFESNTLWQHQVDEWSRLGIALEFPDSPETALSFLAQHPALPIDTRIIARAEFPFDPASWISHEGTVNDYTTGILINSENSQALRLLEKTFSESVKIVYGDPPYNTGDDFFAYKDGFFDSSWMCMIAGTVSALKPLLRDDGLVFMSIDRDEHHNLLPLLFQLFGKSNFVEEIVWQKAYGGGAKTKLVNNLHEYIVCFANSRENLPKLWLPPNDGAARYYRFQDEKVATRGKYRTQPLYTNSNDYRENLTYPLPVPPIADPGSDLWESELKQIREDLKEGRLVVEQNGAKWNVLHNGSDWRGELVRPPKQWQWSWDKTCQAYINNELVFRLEDGEWTVDYKQYELLDNGEPRGTKPGSIEIGPYTQSGTSDLRALFDSEVAKFPKPVDLLKKLCSYDYTDRNGIYLDPFVGSGTTAQAVLALNCADNGLRKFIAMESSITCDVARDRICKCMASSAWEDGKTKQVSGALQVIKYFALESYEDALNNLPSPDGKLFEAMDQVTRHSLITYSLDLEMGPHLLNMDAFKDPWGYKIYAQLAGEDEVSLHNVDMVETFNYLIGLKVQSYGPLERYNAEFVRLPHGDEKDSKGVPLPDNKREGRLRVEGRLRRAAEGPYVYQRVEGELNDGNATRVLVIWRKLTDDAEKDAAVLEAWMARHRETTKERSDYREYHLIYLNGPITLPQPTQELRTVLPTEQTFKDRMFEDT